MLQRRKTPGHCSLEQARQRGRQPMKLRSGSEGGAAGKRPDGFKFPADDGEQALGLGRIDPAGGEQLQNGATIGRHNHSYRMRTRTVLWSART